MFRNLEEFAKFVFDHVRNISLAALVIWSGSYFFEHHKEALVKDYSPDYIWLYNLISLLLMLCGFLLFGLNMLVYIDKLLSIQRKFLVKLTIFLVGGAFYTPALYLVIVLWKSRK